MNKDGLNERVALVTGGNHGIGAAIARQLAEAGAHVFITYYRVTVSEAEAQLQEGEYARQRAQDAEMVVTACRAYGVRADAVEADLSDPAAIPTLFEGAERAVGAVDILINNAAAWQADTFVPPTVRNAQVWPPPDFMHGMSPGSIDLHHGVNVRGSALLIAEYARRHIGRGATWGRIVSITTDANGFPGEVSYGASKAALESYTRAAAKELGVYGITANLVSPGPTQTGWISPYMEADIAARTPLRRVGTPDDVAHAVLLFVSEQGGWLTGQILRAGGGWTI